MTKCALTPLAPVEPASPDEPAEPEEAIAVGYQQSAISFQHQAFGGESWCDSTIAASIRQNNPGGWLGKMLKSDG